MKNVKFGVYAPIYSNAREKLKYATLIERSGFDSVWVGDHMTEVYEGIPCVDPWCVLSAFAVTTDSIMIGTCVTDPHKRHPAALAQTLATADQLSEGRVILGLGGGEAMNLTPFHIPWDRPISRMKEAVEIIKRLLTGERLTYDGEFYKLENAFLHVAPIQKPHPPIYIAGASPKSRRIAGMLGDGWIDLLMTPEMYKKDLEDVKKAATLAKRDITDIDVAYAVYSAISMDYDEAKRTAEETAKRAFLWWPRQLRRYGYVVTDEFDWLKLVVTEGIIDKIPRHLQDVPAEIAEQVCIYGTPDEFIDKIETYINVGVTHFIFSPQGLGAEDVDTFYELVGKKVIPYFEER